MRKRIMMLMLILIISGLVGCSGKVESDAEETKQETEQQEKEETDQREEEENPSENEVAEEPVEKKPVKVYMVNPEDGTLVTEVKECEEVNEQVIWDLLKETGLIKDESNVISLYQEENRIVLDVDSIFGEQLRSQGTAGEQELISCVVNTYLDAYNCDEIKITEEGGVLYSGHREYADYMPKFE